MSNEQQLYSIHTVEISALVLYTPTPLIRYVKKEIEDGETVRKELRLQQMWRGSDGSEKWEWVEEVELD